MKYRRIKSVGVSCVQRMIRQTEEHSLQQSQKMLHSLKLLQMDVDELHNYIEDILLENPVLEFEKPLVHRGERTQNTDTVWDSIRDPNNPIESLTFFLNDQIDRLVIDNPQKRLCKALVLLLDEKGYLNEDNLIMLDVPQEDLAQVLAVLKTLDPPGVGARDLSECLLLQLNRIPFDTSVEELLVKSFLAEIATKNYLEIERKTGLKHETILRAVDRIKELNPKPGRGFEDNRVVQNIYPDYIVEIEDGDLQISRNPNRYFSIKIDPLYSKLYNEKCQGDLAALSYLRKHIESAKLLTYQLQQREKTITRCVETIVKRQRDYFLIEGILVPVTLKDIAEQLNMSQSTISRAINGCYIMFKNKIFPVKFFLAKSINREQSGNISVYHIKALIKEIIENEEPSQPLTDCKICDILLNGGISVSRRTVVKYRGELMIPSSKQRKRL